MSDDDSTRVRNWPIVDDDAPQLIEVVDGRATMTAEGEEYMLRRYEAWMEAERKHDEWFWSHFEAPDTEERYTLVPPGVEATGPPHFFEEAVQDVTEKLSGRAAERSSGD